jgi:predicted transcriptional regulator
VVARDRLAVSLLPGFGGLSGTGRRWIKVGVIGHDTLTGQVRPGAARQPLPGRISRSATKANITLRENPTELRDLEREVMQIVWESGPITAGAARERLTKPLKESTVRTVLKRLEDNEFVTHSVRGRTFIFAAAEACRDVAARAVRRIVERFCNGLVEEVLVGMVDSDMLDAAQKTSPKRLPRQSNRASDAGATVMPERL